MKAFKEMLPVFRHPRCLNCHGGLDPHSEKHPGAGQIEGLDRMANMTEFVEGCQMCHDGLAAWRAPGPPLFFPGKSDEELCKQMKQFEHTGRTRGYMSSTGRTSHSPSNAGQCTRCSSMKSRATCIACSLEATSTIA